jgi:hypothetical protein
MLPAWLHPLASFSLVLAALSCVVILADELAGHDQSMWIMNVVWPITALWAGPLGLVAYFNVGRRGTRRAKLRAESNGEPAHAQTKPFWQSVGVGATHCGAGCALADMVVEWVLLAVPVTLAGSEVFGSWTVDFVAAFTVGIAFQYFTIVPMRGLSMGAGIIAAVKADALSLSAWQIGMYGWMALVLFVWFSPERLPKTGPEFWFMMQLAMMAGFLTAYPVNWWLLRSGMKETM